MRLLLPVFVGIGIAFGLADAVPIEHYSSRYDHLDIETILNNRRMVKYYADCMLSKGPCPPEGLEFKRILPEALRTNCERCTEKQKTVTLRAIRRLKKEYPKIWVQLAEQWDPDNTHVSKFEASFNTRPSESTPQASILIQNKFGGEATNIVENNISQIFTSSTAPSSTKPTTKSTTTTIATTKNIITTKAPTTTSTVSTTSKTSAKVTTNKPTINSFTAATTKTTKKPRLRPNIESSIQATVSLGPSIVGDLVRGLGALGTRVVETGAEIAGVVLKNIARPL